MPLVPVSKHFFVSETAGRWTVAEGNRVFLFGDRRAAISEALYLAHEERPADVTVIEPNGDRRLIASYPL